MTNAETGLNIKQEKFCYEYARTGNATESYRKAYPRVKNDATAVVNANRLLKNAKISGFLSKISEKIACSEIADTAECQRMLTSIARDRKVYAKDRVAAINTLLKAHGAFVQNMNISGALPVVLFDDVKEDD